MIQPITSGAGYGYYQVPHPSVTNAGSSGGSDSFKPAALQQPGGSGSAGTDQFAQLLYQLIQMLMALESGSSSGSGSDGQSGGGSGPPGGSSPIQHATQPHQHANAYHGGSTGAPRAGGPTGGGSSPTPYTSASGGSSPTPYTSSGGGSSPSPSTASGGGGYGGSKMGLGISPTSANGNGNNMQGANWYYNWSTSPTSGVKGEFIPTIHDQANINPTDLANVKNSNAPEVFTFNEPEQGGQANMTVGQAIADWPAIQSAAAGKAIAAPSITNDGDGSGLTWLSQFMQSASASGLKVDALNIHWYGSTQQSDAQNLQSLSQFVTTVHNQHPNMPIDLTEFGLDPNGNSAKQDPAFYSAAANMLNGMSYVQMYAPYGLE